ncbi:MAG: radical SAM protein [Nitrososphaerota archaeon]
MWYTSSFYPQQFYAFRSISITGNSCSLGCKHCEGKVLRTMIPIKTPEELMLVCKKLADQGCRGCLISGGCLPDGSMPLDTFLPTISLVKRELGFKVFVHTGIIRKEMAFKLAEAGVDAALIDVLGSDETIREIYRLDVDIRDYDSSLDALKASGIPFIPHVVVGLHYGRILGEFNALRMISKHHPNGLVIIAFFPLRRTSMEGVIPSSPEDIARVLAEARLMLPRTPMALGCMRPRGRHRVSTDILAVETGVNAIAFPEDEAVKYAKAIGLETYFHASCCAQMWEDLIKGRIYRGMP